MSYRASLSITMTSPAFSTSWCTDNVALYGSTTVSDTFGDGKTEKVHIILSGYSSLILLINKVPIPEPVPPPKECVIWNPCKQSHDSASFLTTSKTESINSAHLPSLTTQKSLQPQR